ncbi:MAG: TonB-dependent receptor plug domain-containing protein [Bacteroidota bacterium]
MTTTTKYREKVLSYWLFIAIWGVCLNAYGQNRLIRGAVQQASDGAPLSGATVLIKGSTQGTFTQEDGRYQIEVPSDNATLVFKYVGFEEQEVPVAGRTTIDISMIASDQYLDEIVVIGYGSVKKSDLTGSVSSLKADDLTPGANISVDQMLQGRAPGVLISQKSGEPGSAMSVKIRGASSISASNEPLYVIDGLPVNNDPVITGTGSGFVGSQNPRNPLNSLNPTDIESIEILKDASATAIYGARGANGVVLITTKKGTGGSMRLTYDGYYGIQSVANKLELLNPSQYQSTLNAIIDEGGGNANERVDNIQGLGIDWQAELYRDAPVQSHNLSFSGGTQNSSYFVSLNYFG